MFKDRKASTAGWTVERGTDGAERPGPVEIVLGIVAMVVSAFTLPWWATAATVTLLAGIGLRFKYKHPLGSVVMLVGALCVMAAMFGMVGNLGRAITDIGTTTRMP